VPQGRFQVQQQTRPLEAVARRAAVGAKRVGAIGLVIVRQGLPLPIEMLDHHLPAGHCMAMDQALGDAQGAQQPHLVTRGIGQGEKGLGGVHVAVGTPVRLFPLPIAAQAFTQGALLLAPEMGLEDSDRLGQQGRRRRSASNCRGTGGQRDEGMQVGGLVASATGIGEPAAELRIAQGTLQCGDAVIDQFGMAGNSLYLRQGETMGHARGVDQLSAGMLREPPARIERGESLVDSRRPGEWQQAHAFISEPGQVGGLAQPTVVGDCRSFHCSCSMRQRSGDEARRPNLLPESSGCPAPAR